MSTLSEKGVKGVQGMLQVLVEEFAWLREEGRKAFGMLLDFDWISEMDFLVLPLLGWYWSWMWMYVIYISINLGCSHGICVAVSAIPFIYVLVYSCSLLIAYVSYQLPPHL